MFGPVSSDSPVPTTTPSSIPTSSPSNVPSWVPTSIPSEVPSSMPSNTPSEIPSNVPSSVPTSQPSSSPSSTPSSVPSSLPSSAPSQQPSVIPSNIPSSVPSTNPSGAPTCIPSNVPSLAPSTVPSSVPTNQPSSATCKAGTRRGLYGDCVDCDPGYTSNLTTSITPTNCTPCDVGTFAPLAGSPQCTPCEAGFYNNQTAQSACNQCTIGHFCPLQSSQPIPCSIGTFSQTLQSIACTLCAAGSFQDENGQFSCKQCNAGDFQNLEGKTSCLPCNPGSFSSAGQASCELCEAGFFSEGGVSECTICETATYAEGEGNVECKSCGINELSGPGSILSDQCFNPLPNFITALFVVVVIVVLAFPYTYMGRFHHAAFLRECRAMFPIRDQLQVVSKALDDRLLRRRNSTGSTGGPKQQSASTCRPIKVFMFLFLSTAVCALSTLVIYLVVILKQIYTSMILFRGIGFTTGIGDFFKLLSNLAAELAEALGLFFIVDLFEPFIGLIKLFATLEIDLGTVEITCLGAQAPLELLINVMIFTFVVLVVESDFHVYIAGFVKLSADICRFLLLYDVDLNGRTSVALACLVPAVALGLNPLIMTLQFLMSMLKFSVFIEQYGLMHASTAFCDLIPAVPMMDTVIATLTSILAWWLLFPAIYTLSKVLVPYGSYLPDRFLPEKYRHEGGVDDYIRSDRRLYSEYFYTFLKYFSFLSADLLLAEVSLYWLHYLENKFKAEEKVAEKKVIDSVIMEQFKVFYKEDRRPSEILEWTHRNRSSLPKYISLCRLTFEELEDRAVYGLYLENEYFISFLRGLFFVITYVFPIGHFFTAIGLAYWYIVVEKYFIFLLICLGIWTDQCVEGYDMEAALVKSSQSSRAWSKLRKKKPKPPKPRPTTDEEKILASGNLYIYIKTRVLRWKILCGYQSIDENNKYKEGISNNNANVEDLNHTLQALIGPRAVLLLMIPVLAPLSVYASAGCFCPPLLLTIKARKYFAPMFLNFKLMIRSVLDEEKGDGGHDMDAKDRRVYWMIIIKAIEVVSLQSRFAQIFYHLFLFTFAMGILYTDPLPWLIVSFPIVFSFTFIKMLDVYIILGKKMKIDDHDMCYFIKYFDRDYVDQMYGLTSTRQQSSATINDDELLEEFGIEPVPVPEIDIEEATDVNVKNPITPDKDEEVENFEKKVVISRMNKPAPPPPKNAKKRSGMNQADFEASKVIENGVGDIEKKLPLPPGYLEKFDTVTNQRYYKNTFTGQKTWQRPSMPGEELKSSPSVDNEGGQNVGTGDRKSSFVGVGNIFGASRDDDNDDDDDSLPPPSDDEISELSEPSVVASRGTSRKNSEKTKSSPRYDENPFPKHEEIQQAHIGGTLRSVFEVKSLKRSTSPPIERKRLKDRIKAILEGSPDNARVGGQKIEESREQVTVNDPLEKKDDSLRNIDIDHKHIELINQLEAGISDAGEWIEKVDAKNGKTYWKHSVTKERTWYKPISLTQPKKGKVIKIKQKREQQQQQQQPMSTKQNFSSRVLGELPSYN